jgi:hypothetical protein
VEYEDAILKQEKSTIQGELTLLESDLSRATDRIDFAKSRFAEIKKVASKDSLQDLAYQYRYEDRIVEAEREPLRLRPELEKVKTKLKLLVDYVGPKRIKELQAAVEKARTDELAKRAKWEAEQHKLTKLREAAKQEPEPVHEWRALKRLDEAIAIEEQLSAKLDQVQKDGEPGDLLVKEIAELTNRLQSAVESARQEQAAGAWARVKRLVQDAANETAGAQAK